MNSMLETDEIFDLYVTPIALEPRTTSFVKEHSTIWQIGINDWVEFWVLICTLPLSVYYQHLRYAFHSESKLYACLKISELLVHNRSDIISLSECIETRTHNHLFCKRTLNHLVKLITWLSWVVRFSLQELFDCMLSSCNVRISEWILTLYLLADKKYLCSRQVQYLTWKCLQWDSNLQPHTSSRNTQQFAKLEQMIELCCEYL